MQNDRGAREYHVLLIGFGAPVNDIWGARVYKFGAPIYVSKTLCALFLGRSD